MASPETEHGGGTTIVFGTSGFSAEILKVNGQGISRDAIDTWHLGISEAAVDSHGNIPKIPSKKVDPGTISIEGHFNPDTVIPMRESDAAETITVTFPTGATWVTSGFMTNFSWEAGDDKMTFSAEIALSGETDGTAAA